MVLHPDLCIVIADGGHARFVRPGAANALHTSEAFDSAALHAKSHDLGSDRPGRSFESASPARHALAPRHDPHALEKEKFIHATAARINETPCTELVLVAPPHVLAILEGSLDGPAKAKVKGTLAKDLTGLPDDALYPHLKKWVPPVRRA